MKQPLELLIRQALTAIDPALADTPFTVERPKQAGHGDYATNAAMQLARALKRNPRDIAAAILAQLPASPWIDRVEIAGAGFLNFRLTAAARQQVVRHILDSGNAWGRVSVGGGRKVQVEFVSANPTGPLHVGHGRGAAYGASLANVLAAAGFDVQREYYVNDAGRQMDILATSTWLRYLEQHAIELTFPANGYQGDYVRDMAAVLRERYGDRLVRSRDDAYAGAPEAASDKEGHLDAVIANAKRLLGDDYRAVHRFVLETQLNDGRDDLNEFRVSFDRWFSEQSLFDDGTVDRALALLENNGKLYEQEGALWFRSTDYGDEKDRVVRRENGQPTYFASDIAYHLNKIERGFDRIINIWGADHHGYIPRVKGAMQALGLDSNRLEVALVQFAVLWRGTEKAAMSTRSGEFVTLRDLRAEVGNDAARFFYVMRKSDAHLDFDLELAKSQKNENPVYYIQYAHARIQSVLRQWGGDAATLVNADCSRLTDDHEAALLRRLEDYPAVVDAAARDLAPHAVAYYLRDLAADLHACYNACQFLVDDPELRGARLALISATGQTLRNGLALLGVEAPDEMRQTG